MAQHASDKTEKETKPQKKSFTFTVSFSTVITVAIILVGGICWAFVMGVIVGRGENPEDHLPQLATLLPKENDVAKTPKSEVMPPEDLQFSTALKNSLHEQETQNEETPPQAAPTTMPKPATPPPTPAKPLVAPEKNVAAPQAPVKNEVSNERFDFSFQVATFNNTEAVDRLRAQLEGEGFRTKMDKRGKLFRVMVLFRGTMADTQTLKQQMVDMKLGTPIQRSKVAVK